MDAKICWVGGHIGLPGNDTADALAEMGSARSTKDEGVDLEEQGYNFEDLLYDDAVYISRAKPPKEPG